MLTNRKNFCFLALTILFISMLTSCKSKQNRLFINDYFFYCETTPQEDISDVSKLNSNFTPLNKKDFQKLSSLLKNKDNFLWLKAEFTLPENLLNKDLALFIAHLKSANKIWLNNVFIGESGRLPPNEFSSGQKAHYYNFTEEILHTEEPNTILIQLWPSVTGSISDYAFIGEHQDAFLTSEILTFFNSKIYIFCAGLMFLISLIYVITFFSLRKQSKVPEYLMFSLQTLCTTVFLISFFMSETPLASIPVFDYLTVIKIFFCTGIIFTIYFEVIFILRYIRIPYSNKLVGIRFFIFCLACFIIWSAKSLHELLNYFPVVFIYLVAQESIVVYQCIRAYKNPRHRKYVVSIIIDSIPILVTIAIDIILRLVTKIDYLPYFTLFGWQVTIFMFLNNLLQSLIESYKKNITLKRDLYSKVHKQTAELSEKNEILTNQIRIINADLYTATSVQQGFLPPKEVDFDNWDIAITYLPVENVSGDLYDYYKTENCLNGISLFDVSGHGTSAALLTMLSKNIIYQNYIEGKKSKLKVSKILENINDSIVQQKSYSDKYLTGVLFDFAKKENDCIKGTMASAGHPAPIFYKASEDQVYELKTDQTEKQFGVIGFKDFEVSFADVPFETHPNDIIVLFTDGITESTNKDGTAFGKTRLMNLIKRYNFHSSQKLLEIVLDSLNNFTGNIAIKDDITIVTMKRKSL